MEWLHIGPLWETNANVQFILGSYYVVSYYNSYLTKVKKIIVNQLMQLILNKCKHEQT